MVALGLCARAASGAPAAVTDDRSHVIRLATVPARIVTLLPSLTESVVALGAERRLVGTDRYSNWPASVVALPKVGGLDDASLEHIVALHPDLVVAASSSRVIDRLEELGIPVVALRTDSLEDVHRVLLRVAQLLGVPAKGEEVWQALNARVAGAVVGVPPNLRGDRVYFEVSEAPYAASAGSFVGELLAKLGLRSAVPAELGPFPKLNPEYVVRVQPELIMSSEAALAGMRGRPGWAAVRALRDRRTCGFSSDRFDLLVRPGPRLGEAAELIVACLRSLPVEATR
jgi:iron complex transport system substrate-binding protein